MLPRWLTVSFSLPLRHGGENQTEIIQEYDKLRVALLQPRIVYYFAFSSRWSNLDQRALPVFRWDTCTSAKAIHLVCKDNPTGILSEGRTSRLVTGSTLIEDL